MMRNVMTKAVAIVSVFALVGGCASSPEVEQASDADEQRSAQEQAQAALDAMPEWAVDAPDPDSRGVYGVGEGQSDNAMAALREARIESEFRLTQEVDQTMSGIERQYTRNVDGQHESEMMTAVERLVNDVPLRGHETLEEEVVVMPDGTYQAFVKSLIDYDAMQRMLVEESAQAQSQGMKEAFDILEQRLEEASDEGEVAEVAEQGDQ